MDAERRPCQLVLAEASARRLERHALATPAADLRPADIVDLMCGAHAQVMSAAELSVALRMEGAARDVIRDALWSEHALVKTFGPRGTVHLLPARDLPMWTGALSAAPTAYPEGVLMTAEQTDQVIEAIGAALSTAELTVDELEEAVVAATGPWAAERVLPAWYEMWPRWRQAVHKAAQRGVLWFGPNRGRRVTYTNPHRWRPAFEPLPSARISSPARCGARIVGRPGRQFSGHPRRRRRRRGLASAPGRPHARCHGRAVRPTHGPPAP